MHIPILKTIFATSFLLLYGLVTAQIVENFDGDLSVWEGDVSDFMINDNNELQLNTEGSGTSLITTPVALSGDFTMEVDIFLDFSPSSSNRTNILFFSEGMNKETGNGIGISIGKTGSDDPVNIGFFNAGNTEVSFSGKTGGVGTDPAMVRVRIEKISAQYTVYTDYGSGFLEPEGSFTGSETFALSRIGIECIYTSSRSSAFFFDDVIAIPYEEDITPPQLTSSRVLSEDMIELCFDEILAEEGSGEAMNYSLDNGVGMALSASVVDNCVELLFENSIESGPTYVLTFSGVTDRNGNVANGEVPNIVISVGPSPSDLVINEILFDPFTQGEDFVEIINRSDKILNLAGVEIQNAQREESRIIDVDVSLLPGEIIALTQDKRQLEEIYDPPLGANIIITALPAFNNDEGNVSLLWDGQVIDSYDYQEDYHNALLRDTEGVSLERISPDASSDDPGNWLSGVSVTGFATPGYKNASFIESIMGTEDISLRSEVFTPDGDGVDDQLVIDFNIEENGLLARARVFNDQGHLIKDLVNNVTIDSDGFLTWDGSNDEGSLARMGIYILQIEVFNSNGFQRNKKMACVLVKDF